MKLLECIMLSNPHFSQSYIESVNKAFYIVFKYLWHQTLKIRNFRGILFRMHFSCPSTSETIILNAFWHLFFERKLLQSFYLCDIHCKHVGSISINLISMTPSIAMEDHGERQWSYLLSRSPRWSLRNRHFSRGWVSM